MSDFKQVVPGHGNQRYRSRTKYWSGTDSKEQYNEYLTNLEKKDILETLGWVDAEIAYNYNSEGFRDTEFDCEIPSFIALGCSYTEGVGLYNEQTWVRQLDKLLGVKVWNLGVGASSLDTSFRILEYWINNLNVIGVFCQVPPKNRFEIFAHKEWHSFGPWTERGIPKWLGVEYYKIRMAFEENSLVNRQKNLLAMDQICKNHNVNFIYDCDATMNLLGQDHKARDLQHAGADAQKKLAENFYKQWRENNDS